MKSVAILAFAAGASATFRGSNPFTCPTNTDNKCTDKQSSGFDWSDLQIGTVGSYNNFNFKGWTCGQDNSKRSRVDRRTSGKHIGASCGSTKQSSPSFGCSDAFSLNEFHLSTEFDTDLEFHYDMPDGSTCKHRSSCKQGGSTVKNTQCGGAKNVTIVYPSQSNKPKPSCSVTVTSINFDCSTKTSTKTKSTQTQQTTTKPVTTTSEKTTSATKPVESTTTTSPSAETTPTTAPTTPATTETTAPVESTSVTSSVITTEYVTTSTVFTTSVSTIISCAEDVKSCPGKSSTAVVTVTIPVSTTICPVTETQTVPVTHKTKPTQNTQNTEATTAPTTPATTAATGTTTSSSPVETLPCPDVVPSCLNTWLFTLENCKDNTDSDCYCPDKAFVENIFNCIYAYGADDDIVDEAVKFFQGICAAHAPSNPAIVTGPTCTSYITPTKTHAATVPVVTVVVSQTTVVPCTNSAGSVIPSSSSTVVINTSVTVPQVGFTTGPSSDVVLVPVTTAASQPAGTYVATPVASTTKAGAAAGTGSVKPSSSSTVPVQVNGAGRVQAAGIAGLAVMAVVAAF